MQRFFVPNRIPALSPLGARVDRTGVFFSRGGPGEGVPGYGFLGFDPLTPSPSPLRGRGENVGTRGAALKGGATQVREKWIDSRSWVATP